MKLSHLFLIHTVFLTSLLTTTTNAKVTGFRLDLTRLHRNTDNKYIKHAIKRSKRRASDFPNVHPMDGEYLIDVAVGTPAHQFTAILDTGSDLIWTQCITCSKCISQPDPLFNPFLSSTISTIPCSSKICQAITSFQCVPNCYYTYSYGDGTTINGFLAKETLTLGKTRIGNIAFGCGLLSVGTLSNSSGIVGFGRGPLSLISQWGVKQFSYCLTSYEDLASKSPLFFGSHAKLHGEGIKRTPLLQSQSASSFYYLPLKGITVGKTRLPIKSEYLQLKEDGSGGTIIDSGTAVLMLNQFAYEEVVKAFKSQVKLTLVNGTDLEGLEYCFKSSTGAEEMPALMLHFEGADWNLPRDNYIYHDGQAGLLCLAAAGSGSNMSTIGNVATQNMHVLYDLEKNVLSFKPENCDEL